MHSTADARQSGKLEQKSKRRTESSQLYFKVCYRHLVLPKTLQVNRAVVACQTEW